MAEGLGYDFVSANDHMTTSPAVRARDPAPPNFYEALISLACIAAVTRRLEMIVGVLIMPLREPVLLAKQVATLDVFSNGRIMLGLGIGSQRNEIEAVNPRWSKANRGQILEEGIQALQILFSQDEASFKGRYYEFQGVSLHPRPVQQPFPIHISGDHPDTYRRIARWGSGMFTRGTPEEVRKTCETLRPLLEEYGRDPSEIKVTVTTAMSIARTHEKAIEKFLNSRIGLRHRGQNLETVLAENFIGAPTEIAEKIAKLGEAGVSRCMGQNLAVDNYEEFVEMLQLFGEEVIPHFKKP